MLVLSEVEEGWQVVERPLSNNDFLGSFFLFFLFFLFMLVLPGPSRWPVDVGVVICLLNHPDMET